MSENDKMKSAAKEKSKRDDVPQSNVNLFVMAVIIIIILTFVVTGGSVLGINKLVNDFGKERIDNPDGSISIPADAETEANKNNPETYIGKLLGERIQLNKSGDFNRKIVNLFNYQGMNPYQKYQYARMAFDEEINKIIAMYNAKRMQIKITSDTDKLIKEIGKRYFADEDGEVNFYEMRKNPSEVNLRVDETRKSLLLENFKKDYFQGLPVDKDESWNNFKLESHKVAIDYVNINNNDVDDEKVEAYFKQNIDKYQECRLTRLVFNNQDDAIVALDEILINESKLYDLGEQLKEEGKILNIVYDSNFTFIEDIEEQSLRDLVKITEQGGVGKSVATTNVGPMIILVSDKRFANIKDSNVNNKVKNEYISLNAIEIEESNKQKAEDIFKMAKDNGLKKAANKYNIKIETSSEVAFLDYMPNINKDLTADRMLITQIFKGEIGDVYAPHKNANGYMVASVNAITKTSELKYEDLYEDLMNKFSDRKSRNIENDFYRNERKKYKIIDNFQYVLNYQMFMPPQEGEANQQ